MVVFFRPFRETIHDLQEEGRRQDPNATFLRIFGAPSPHVAADYTIQIKLKRL